MTEPMELVGVIRRSLHKNGMILSVVPVEQLLADAADTIEKLCNLPRDKQEAVKALQLQNDQRGVYLHECYAEITNLRARVEELEQDLIDARSGWESAVELNRELDARTEELEKALANAKNEAYEEAAKLCWRKDLTEWYHIRGAILELKSPEVTK